MDREAMARPGVRATAALEAIEVGVGGLNIGIASCGVELWILSKSMRP